MLQSIRDRTKATGTFLSGCAWFFILVSLAHLAWVIGIKIPDPAGLTSLYQTTVGDVTYRASGLTYDGGFGLVQAFGQAAIVVAAAIGSLMPITRIRRIAHVALVVWAGWWTLNLGRLAVLDGQIESILQTSFMSFLTLATTVRGARCWFDPRPKTAPFEPPVIQSDAALATDYVSTRTDVAPAERLVLRLRDVDSDALEEVRPSKIRAARDGIAKKAKGAGNGARKAVNACRRGGAVCMFGVAGFAQKQGDRLDPNGVTDCDAPDEAMADAPGADDAKIAS